MVQERSFDLEGKECYEIVDRWGHFNCCTFIRLRCISGSDGDSVDSEQEEEAFFRTRERAQILGKNCVNFAIVGIVAVVFLFINTAMVMMVVVLMVKFFLIHASARKCLEQSCKFRDPGHFCYRLLTQQW